MAWSSGPRKLRAPQGACRPEGSAPDNQRSVKEALIRKALAAPAALACPRLVATVRVTHTRLVAALLLANLGPNAPTHRKPIAILRFHPKTVDILLIRRALCHYYPTNRAAVGAARPEVVIPIVRWRMGISPESRGEF